MNRKGRSEKGVADGNRLLVGVGSLGLCWGSIILFLHSVIQPLDQPSELLHRPEGEELMLKASVKLPAAVSNSTAKMDSVGTRTLHPRWKCPDEDGKSKLIYDKRARRYSDIKFNGVDFYVAGWPKTGTTTLLNGLSAHPEVAMPKAESWWWWRNGSEEKELTKIEMELARKAKVKRAHLAANATVKRGIKCPGEYNGWHGLKFLGEGGWGTKTKVVIGLRHPVKLFESFFNFRVQDWHTKGSWYYLKGQIPHPDTLFGNDFVWGGGINAQLLRFDQYLSLLMKVPPPPGKWKGLGENPDRNCFQNEVFLYHIDQIGDRDEVRSSKFRDALSRFLELEQPLAPFVKKNALKKKYPESIDICNSMHNYIRQKLIDIGRESYEWIVTQFLSSDTVTVANLEHFTTLMLAFRFDPCLNQIPV